MSQFITVKLSRGDSTSWGFRLQGGKDFSSPLSVQRVNPGSLADNAGMVSGDAIVKIKGQSTEFMKHKEAQDHILKSGNSLELVIQRGGIRVWKPSVTPVGELPNPVITPNTPSVNTPSINTPSIYTKTSLAANKQEFKSIGAKHNVSPRPFANLGEGKMLVNNQYNSPSQLYSMNNIAETLSAHTEVLSSGAKGINFLKDPGPVNKESAVYRMIMEEKQRSEDFNHVDKQEPSVTQHVSAPITKPPSQNTEEVDPNACLECGKMIIGVFVRVKGRSLHPECFRCSTCGTSLKNQGYYSVNEKLYCDMHAQLASRVAAMSPTYEPAALSHMPDPPQEKRLTLSLSPTPQTPTPGPLSPTSLRSVSPTPFHKSNEIHHVEAPTSPLTLISPPVFKSATTPAFKSPTAPAFKIPTTPVFKPATTPAAPTTPGTPFSTPVVAPFKPCPPMTQLSKPSAPIQTAPSNLTTHFTGAAGLSKFVWPPPKSSFSEITPIPKVAPAAPMYRPPPGTQHFQGGLPRSLSSPMSPPPPQTAPIQKIAPPTCPKPHNPVQAAPRQHGLSAAGPGRTTWSSKTTTSSGLSSSTVTTDSPLSSGPAGSRPAPRRGRGQMKTQVGAGTRIPICSICGTPIRGPFVTAMGKTWCPEHFTCANNRCQRSLIEIGFVENHGLLYCESCYEVHLAPICAKCSIRIKGHCLNALDKQWHPECFVCAHCHMAFGNSSFYMEDGLPYCEKDWNELFTTKCVGCGFPIEAGDRWVEALNNNYHSQCFKCSKCHKNLEGQSFYAKGGRPFCKIHAR